MRPSLSVIAVLATAMTTLVEAAPVPAPIPAPEPGLIHIPLQPVSRRTDVPAEVLLQQHINRAHRRLAHMTGTRAPTEEELENNLRKRLWYPPKNDDAAAPEKRFQGNSAVYDALNNYRNGKRSLADIIKIVQDEQAKGANTQEIIQAVIAEIQKEIQAKLGAGGLQGGQKGAKKGGKMGKGKKKGKGNKNGGMNGQNNGNNGNNGNGQAEADKAAAEKAAAEKAAAEKAAADKAAKDKEAAGGAAGGAAGDVQKDNSKGFNPVDAAAAKNGGLTKANKPADANSIGLDVEANDVGYIGTIQIGTPPRDFRLLMDSGSADMWVGSEVCKSLDGGDCGPHTFLGSKSSSTFKDTGKPFQVKYGAGSVAGNIITDTISIAKGLDLKDHVFGVATQESVEFSGDRTSFDGLIGLAQSTLSNQKTLTPIEALFKNKLVAAPITSYKISRIADLKNDGQITFGGLDETKFDPKTLITVKNVNTRGFWESDLAVSVGGKDIGLKGRTAILDTGTSLIVAPPADALAFHQAIPGAKSDGRGGFTIPCTTEANVSFTIGGSEFTIDNRDLPFVPVNAADPTGDCISGISAGQIGGAQEWLVGDVFLKNVYFSHDVEKNTVSLAKLI